MIDAAEREGLLAARRHDRRADVGQHRRRPRDRRRAARLPLHLRDVRQDERREGRAAARVRRRGGGVPDRGAARAPRLVLLRRRPAHARDAGRVPARPVLQPAPTRPSTSARPAPRSGARPRAGSRTSSPASAPAARSPASRRYLKAQNPDVQIIGADPEGSVYSGGTGRPYLVEGVGEDFWPTDVRPGARRPRRSMVTDAESFVAARRVTREEGLLIGGSGGTAVHAALVVGARARPRRPRRRAASRLGPRLPLEDLRRRVDDATSASCAPTGPIAGDVLDAKRSASTDPIPELVLITPDEPARRAFALMRDLGVSQLVVSVTTELPLAAKEVSGTRLASSSSWTRRSATRRCSTGRSARSWSPPMPMVGIGETVSRRGRAASTSGPSVLVLDGGHPVGVLTRSDVLAFLAGRGHPDERQADERRRLRDPGDPRRPGSRPATGAVVPPISLATTFAQDAVGEHRGYEYGAHRQPDPARARGVPRRRSRARRTASRSRAAWPPRTPCCAQLAPGDHVIIPDDAYGGTYRLVSKVLAPTGVEWSAVDLTSTRRARGGVARRRRRSCGSRRRRTRCSPIVDIAAVAERRARARRAGRRRQHVRDAVPPAAARARRRRRRALEHEVPRRALRRRRRVRRRRRRRARRRSSRSCRTRSARCRRRSTATSCCAASRRSRCAWTATARTPRAVVDAAGRAPRGRAGAVPGAARRTRATTSRGARCADFGGMVSFLAVRRRGRGARDRRARPGCSRSPSRSARSSR